MNTISDFSPPSYAGFWWRFWAAILDGLLVMLAFGLYGVPLLMGEWLQNGSGGALSSLDHLMTGLSFLVNPDFSSIPEGHVAAFVTFVWVLVFLGVRIIYAVFEASSWQATPGKRLLGLAVTDLEGGRLSFPQAFLRQFWMVLSDITTVGYIMAGVTGKKQALHDMLTRSLVVRKKTSKN